MSEDRIWFVYLLECTGGILYTGITPNLEARFRKHCTGLGGHFTRSHAPVRMLAAEPCSGRDTASQLEYHVKRLSASEKRSLASRWGLTTGLPTRPE